MTETTASLPGLDEFQQRAYDNLRNRHAEQARKAAEEIAEYVGYVLRDLAARKYLPTRYAKDILDDALELAQRLRILDELGQVTGILESVDEGGAARADSRLPPYQPG